MLTDRASFARSTLRLYPTVLAHRFPSAVLAFRPLPAVPADLRPTALLAVTAPTTVLADGCTTALFALRTLTTVGADPGPSALLALPLPPPVHAHRGSAAVLALGLLPVVYAVSPLLRFPALRNDDGYGLCGGAPKASGNGGVRIRPRRHGTRRLKIKCNEMSTASSVGVPDHGAAGRDRRWTRPVLVPPRGPSNACGRFRVAQRRAVAPPRARRYADAVQPRYDQNQSRRHERSDPSVGRFASRRRTVEQ